MLSTREPLAGVRGVDWRDRGMRWGIAAGGLVTLALLAWGHLGLGALVSPPATGPASQMATAGAYQVTLQQPAAGFHASAGEQATLLIRDASGAPITDATVSVRQEMKTMAMATPPPTVSAQGDGAYLVHIPFAMAGDWRLHVRVARPGAPAAECAFDVGVRWT